MVVWISLFTSVIMALDFSGQNLRGRSFRGQDLAGANFSYADIRGASFAGANLRDANFCHVKAGLQKRWTWILVGFSWFIAGFAGFSNAFFGLLIVILIKTSPIEDSYQVLQVAGWALLLTVAIILVLLLWYGMA